VRRGRASGSFGESVSNMFWKAGVEEDEVGVAWKDRCGMGMMEERGNVVRGLRMAMAASVKDDRCMFGLVYWMILLMVG
jgi:hypothetical protein